MMCCLRNIKVCLRHKNMCIPPPLRGPPDPFCPLDISPHRGITLGKGGYGYRNRKICWKINWYAVGVGVLDDPLNLHKNKLVRRRERPACRFANWKLKVENGKLMYLRCIYNVGEADTLIIHFSLFIKLRRRGGVHSSHAKLQNTNCCVNFCVNPPTVFDGLLLYTKRATVAVDVHQI